jgi:hypothetical protein
VGWRRARGAAGEPGRWGDAVTPTHEVFARTHIHALCAHIRCRPLANDDPASCSPAKVATIAGGGRVQVAWQASGQAEDDYVQVCGSRRRWLVRCGAVPVLLSREAGGMCAAAALLLAH